MEIVQLPGAALRAFPFLLPLSGEKIRQGPKMKPELERMPNATVSFCNMSPVDTAWPSHTPILLSMYLYISMALRFFLSLPCKSMPNSGTFMPWKERRWDFAKSVFGVFYADLKYYGKPDLKQCGGLINKNITFSLIKKVMITKNTNKTHFYWHQWTKYKLNNIFSSLIVL